MIDYLGKPRDLFHEVFPLSVIIQYVYKQSKIDLNNYYETCASISYNMNISQNEIDNLEFYVYMNLGVYLSNIIEAENKAQKGEMDSHNDMMRSYQHNMSSMKNSFSPSKAPKFKA